MSEDDDNVISLRPAKVPSVEVLAAATQQELREVVKNLMTYCERLDESLQHVVEIIVAMDVRLRKLELAHNKAQREKLQKIAILNPQGQKVS